MVNFYFEVMAEKPVCPRCLPVGKILGAIVSKSVPLLFNKTVMKLGLSKSVQTGENEGKNPKLLANETLYQLS
jgi:hypothetical protein